MVAWLPASQQFAQNTSSPGIIQGLVDVQIPCFPKLLNQDCKFANLPGLTAPMLKPRSAVLGNRLPGAWGITLGLVVSCHILVPAHIFTLVLADTGCPVGCSPHLWLRVDILLEKLSFRRRLPSAEFPRFHPLGHSAVFHLKLSSFPSCCV